MSTNREVSRKEWLASEVASIEQINSGSLQRIADGVELVSKNYQALINERDYWRRRTVDGEEGIARLRRSYSALKANFTRRKSRTKSKEATS